MIIINADDFGMNKSCSRAIAQACSKGYVTDTTMMATGGYFDEAVALAKEQGFFDRIGIHFSLTEGVPLTEAICCVSDFVSGGRFHKRYDPQKPLTKSEENAVYEELTAQVMKLKNAGIRITHADSHHYLHNAPYLAPVFVRVCREQGIEKIRLQRNLGVSENAEAVNAFYRAQGLRTVEYFGRLRDLEDTDIPDNTEILVHPDFDKDGRLIDRKGMEDGYPTGELIPDLKKRYKIILGSYKDL